MNVRNSNSLIGIFAGTAEILLLEFALIVLC